MKSILLFSLCLFVTNVSFAGILQCHYIKPSSYLFGRTVQSPDGTYKLVHQLPDGVEFKAKLTPDESNTADSQSLLHLEMTDPNSGLTKSVTGLVKENEALETSDFMAANGQVYQARCSFSHKAPAIK